MVKAHQHRDKIREQKLLTAGIPTFGAFHRQGETVKEHGRIETRSCTVIAANHLSSREKWEGLQSIARICRERREGDKIERTKTYYITSLPPSSEMIEESIREHWGVEIFHWRLDVTFKQDNSRYRNRVGARNLAVVRKLALQVLLNFIKRGHCYQTVCSSL